MLYSVYNVVVRNIRPKYDDDCIDRLNYAYTSGIFVLLILVLSIKQYVGVVMQCWFPAEYNYNWQQYIEKYCYIENTYFSSYEKDRLPLRENREVIELRYYQWIPFFLMAQLILFLLPRLCWSTFSWKTGLNIRAIIGKIIIKHGKKENIMLSSKIHQENCRHAAKYIQDILNFNNDRTQRCMKIFPAKTYTSYLTMVYLFHKILNCINSIAQLWVMNQFMNTSYTFWGFGILKDLINERNWKVSGTFPRVTFCDYMRRDDVSSKPMIFTVECVLMLNMFNEKLYIMLWFWLMILSICNLANLFYWLLITFIDDFSQKFIKAQLKFSQQVFTNEQLTNFIKDKLHTDGITTIRLISANAGDLISSDILGYMFKSYKDEHAKKEKVNDVHSLMPVKVQHQKEKDTSSDFTAKHQNTSL